MNALRRVVAAILMAVASTASGATAQDITAGGSLFAGRDDAATCVQSARRAASAESVPLDLLLAVGLTESGRTLDDGRAVIWPWTVATQEGGVFYASRNQAQRAIERHLAAGRTVVDVGCMQINYRWHRDAFSSVSAMLDPMTNALYAAKHLRELFEVHGDWEAAAARYHTGDDERGRAYADKVIANRRFADAAFDAPTSAGRLDLFTNGARKPLHGGVALNKAPQPILPGYAAGEASG